MAMARLQARFALSALFATAALGGALAHHSFAMFDTDNPVEMIGVVKEFKYTNPHTFILLDVKNARGETVTWSLEGGSPSALVREGWSSRTVKPGDEIKIMVKPLRSGAPGGAWEIPTTFRKDGSRLGNATH